MTERQHRARRHAVRGTASVALVLALAGLMFTANARLARSEEGRHPQNLEGLAAIESARVEELAGRVDGLRAEVERLTESATRTVDTGDPAEDALVEFAAGRSAATGPGVTVALTDAPADAPQREGIQPDDLVVHQQDLQAVINALWAGGAEAMALQDQRVTATTAFRCVGNVLSLGGRVYSPPYEVRAIGDPRALRAALEVSPEIRRYQEWVAEVGLGWSVTTQEVLELPAAEGEGELAHARVPDGVDVFPGDGGRTMTAVTEGSRAGRGQERTDRVDRRPGRGRAALYGTVGVVGELMITAGVLLGGFVVWQLWWTDVEGDRAQARIVEDLGWEVPATASAPGDDRDDRDDGVAPPAAVAVPAVGEPPVPSEPEHATTFATLVVPRWVGEPERPISQGVDRATVLDPLGLGHYPGTAMPGAVGNFAVAGHRTTYGKPLHRVEELVAGDPLVVRTADTWYVYRVTSTRIVAPAEVEVIAPDPVEPAAVPTQRSITLTTCHPMFSARERYIVHGVLDYWAPADGPAPAELAAVPDPAPQAGPADSPPAGEA